MELKILIKLPSRITKRVLEDTSLDAKSVEVVYCVIWVESAGKNFVFLGKIKQ